MGRVLKFLKRYFSDRRYMSAGFCGLHALYFMEGQLGFGPGLDNIWVLAYLLHGLLFLILSFWKTGFFAAFAGCCVLTIGGCSAFSEVTGVPEETQIEMAKYNRIRLGKYSEWIPVGAWDIRFSYYVSLFSSATVRCKVSEADFKWFCWRNRKRIRSDRTDFNERTQEPSVGNRCPWRGLAEGRVYAHVYQYRNAGGWFIFYNRDTQEMYLDFSTN